MTQMQIMDRKLELITAYLLAKDAGSRKQAEQTLKEFLENLPLQGTLTIKLKPDENRQYIKIAASAVSKLAPATPVGTTLGIAADGNGEMVIVESVPQVPGQMNLEGTEQEAPKMLRIAAMK